MVERHYRLSRYGFELQEIVKEDREDREGRQESLVRCSLWGRKELDTTEQLN